MKTFRSTALLLGGFVIAIESASAQTWTTLHDGHGNTWAPLTLSANGTKSAAIVNFGAIYVSTNSGIAWTLSRLPPTNGYTTGIASSADGNRLVAASGGAIMISTNSGTTWTNVNLSYNPAESAWVASSADGNRLLVVIDDLFPVFEVSKDSGMTWNATTNTAEPGQSPGAICSADGTKMAVIDNAGLSTSTNAGADWQFQPFQSVRPSGLASAADGNKLFLLSSAMPTYLYISTNWGATWSSNLVSFSSGTALACSADGSRLVAVGNFAASNYISAGTSIYTSTNSGLTWASNSAPTGAWLEVASSADGDKLLAVKALGPAFPVGTGGGIYGTQSVPTPRLNMAPGGVLSWVFPSTNFVLQENVSLATTNWTILTNTPTLNFSNMNDEVVLLPSKRSSFFRLMAH